MCGSGNAHQRGCYRTGNRTEFPKGLHDGHAGIGDDLRGLNGEVDVSVLLLYLQLLVGLFVLKVCGILSGLAGCLYLGIVLRIDVGHLCILKGTDGIRHHGVVPVKLLLVVVGGDLQFPGLVILLTKQTFIILCLQILLLSLIEFTGLHQTILLAYLELLVFILPVQVGDGFLVLLLCQQLLSQMLL